MVAFLFELRILYLLLSFHGREGIQLHGVTPERYR